MPHQKNITDYILYKWRYALGYALLPLLIIAMVFFIFSVSPGGLRAQEIAQITQSGSIDFANWQNIDPINLPYQLMQFALFSVFGVGIITAKLPSLLLMILTVLAFFYLFRKWTKPTVAFVITAVFATSQPLLFAAQDATAYILSLFWIVSILLIATQITTRARGQIFWKMSLFPTLALSLYSPLSVYPLVALFLVNIAHPHMRLVGRHLGKRALTLGVVLGVFLLVPLGYAIYKEYTQGLLLLGIGDHLPSALENIKQLGLLLFSTSGTSLTPVTPILSYAILALALLGVISACVRIHTARSYLLAALSLFYGIAVCLSPDFYILLLVPILFAAALGFEALLDNWYRLFPKNPYARVSALLPLSVLVVSIVGMNMFNFSANYHYNPKAVKVFSNDLTIIKEEAYKKSQLLLVPNSKEYAFYKTVARFNSNISVAESEQNSTSFYATKAKAAELNTTDNLAKIITNDRTENSDRLYLFEKR